MTRRFKPLGTAKDRTTTPELSARDKLSNSFIRALEADWAEHGAAVIERLRVENIAKYSELIGRLVPMEINAPASPFAEAKSTRDVCRLLLQQADVPEWLISDDMIDRIHDAHQHLAEEIEAIKAAVVEN